MLHDVFGLTFDEIAEVVGRSPAAARKLASRARSTIATTLSRGSRSHHRRRAVADRFSYACATGDLAALIAALAPDVVGEFGSGGRIADAPLGPLVGADLVGVTLAATLFGAGAAFRVASVNGEPGVVVSLVGHVMAVIALETHDKRRSLQRIDTRRVGLLEARRQARDEQWDPPWGRDD